MKYLRKFENFKPGSILDKDADKGKGGFPSGTYKGKPDKVKSLEDLEKEGNYKPGSILDKDAK